MPLPRPRPRPDLPQTQRRGLSLARSDLDMSFSGLKTAVSAALAGPQPPSPADLCASFQEAVVDVLYRDTEKALRQPAFLERFTQQGLDVLVTAPAAFGRFLESELQRWDTVVKKAGIKVD